MKREQEGEVEAGFLSGSDDDFDEEENFKMKEDRGKKRKNSEGSEDSEEDEGEHGDKNVVKRTKKIGGESEEEDINDDLAGEDEVEDLNLEDLDSDLEMDDDFGAADDVEEDNSEEDSDDSDE
jgi:hypothetical protein